MNIVFKCLDSRLNNEWPVFENATKGSAGFDLRSCTKEILFLKSQSVELIPTGIAIHISDPNYCGLIFPRSGLGHRGLVLGNLTGLIDSDYQGELKISAWNRSTELIEISPGDRIAQLIIVPIVKPSWKRVDDFELKSIRGSSGYGHSGIK